MTIEQEQIEKIRAGRSAPLAERQARWDRIQEWSKTHSLAQMSVLEAGVSGVSLSRERIRAIKDGARPGSVGRPRLPGLLARQRRAKERLALWRRKPKTDYQAAKVDEARRELAAANAALRAEQRRVGR